MANVTLGPLAPVNMETFNFAALFLYEDVAIAAGSVLLSDDPSNFTLFTGTLTYDPSTGTMTGGTIATIQNVVAGNAVFTVTGLSYPATDFQTRANFSPLTLTTQLFSGNDTITGSDFADVIVGQGGNDVVKAGGGADTAYGGTGNDVLDGGLGADSLVGGSGNDRYVVDTAADRIVEAAGAPGGVDIVEAAGSYTLQAGAAVEVLRVLRPTGTATVHLTGNGFDNAITGNDGLNILNGGGGADILDGRRGADTMVGGAGNDVFYVDVSTDRAVELVGGGTDQVITKVSFALASNAEVEVLRAATPTALTPLDLTGNGFANRLFGSAAANRLDGGGERDFYVGYAGNDTFVGGAGEHDVADYRSDGGGTGIKANLSSTVVQNGIAVSTILDGFGGRDSVAGILDVCGSAFGDTMAGGVGANRLYGFAGSDALSGGLGADTLGGGAGADLLNGGADADWFLFDTAPSSPTRDVVVDFVSGVDKLVFDNAVYTHLPTPGGLTVPPLSFGSALAYDVTTGNITYDIDGLAGPAAAIVVATLLNKPVLKFSDVLVI